MNGSGSEEHYDGQWIVNGFAALRYGSRHLKSEDLK